LSEMECTMKVTFHFNWRDKKDIKDRKKNKKQSFVFVLSPLTSEMKS